MKPNALTQPWLSEVNNGKLMLKIGNDVFKEDVLTGGDHHFQTLKHFISEWEDFDPATLQSYADFISQIANEFQKRFSQFQGITAVIDLVNTPLAADPQGAWKQQVAQVADLSIGCIQLQLCDLLAQEKEAGSVDFWIQEDMIMREISRFDQVGKKGANVLRVHICV